MLAARPTRQRSSADVEYAKKADAFRRPACRTRSARKIRLLQAVADAAARRRIRRKRGADARSRPRWRARTARASTAGQARKVPATSDELDEDSGEEPRPEGAARRLDGLARHRAADARRTSRATWSWRTRARASWASRTPARCGARSTTCRPTSSRRSWTGCGSR